MRKQAGDTDFEEESKDEEGNALNNSSAQTGQGSSASDENVVRQLGNAAVDDAGGQAEGNNKKEE